MERSGLLRIGLGYLSVVRVGRFGLRSLMVFVGITGTALGLLVARYQTVQRYNAAYEVLEKETWSLVLSTSPQPTIASVCRRAELFQYGHFDFTVTDGEKSFWLDIECSSTRLFYGRPVCTIRPKDSIGVRPLNASRDLAKEFAKRLPKDTMRVVQGEPLAN